MKCGIHSSIAHCNRTKKAVGGLITAQEFDEIAGNAVTITFFAAFELCEEKVTSYRIAKVAPQRQVTESPDGICLQLCFIDVTSCEHGPDNDKSGVQCPFLGATKNILSKSGTGCHATKRFDAPSKARGRSVWLTNVSKK